MNLLFKNSFRKSLSLFACSSLAMCLHQGYAEVTTVKVEIPEAPTKIDPMIYGQMLENVNDQMIYGGVTNVDGTVREHLIQHFKDLQIPIMRWPGGSAIFEYNWYKGVGPKNLRPVVEKGAWGGVENYQFGTDEFLQWCTKVGTVPYLNFNMSTQPDFEEILTEALDWIAYVNGDENTKMGKLRAKNGHKEPYNVKYWCIGNENYLGGMRGRIKETETMYSRRLHVWASAIRQNNPDLKLLAVGNTLKWNETVLERNGHLIDYLTHHYYMNSRVKDDQIQNPINTLFAPAEMETHLALLGEQLDKFNEQLGRKDNPIRLSVDEWNNRHSVFDGEKFKLDRQSPRRTFDVAVAAGVLNAFIRQSQHVTMANYIFPVNAHGLIRTVGDDDSFKTSVFYVFKEYREQMVGKKINASVEGPSVELSSIKPSISGDNRHDKIYSVFAEQGKLPYIDSAAVIQDDGNIHLSLVNRSPETSHKVSVTVPDGYTPFTIWRLTHPEINATNTAENREVIQPTLEAIAGDIKELEVEIPACGLLIVKFLRGGQ